MIRPKMKPRTRCCPRLSPAAPGRPRRRRSPRQGLVGGLLHGEDRLARAETGGRAAGDLHRWKAVETRDQFRRSDVARGDQRRQRDVGAVGRAHVDLVEVVGLGPVVGVGLQDHEPDAAELRELAGDLRAEVGLHRLEHVADVHAEHLGLVAVEVDEQLLAVGAEGGADAPPAPPRARPWRGKPAAPRPWRAARPSRVLHVELEATGGAEARDRGGFSAKAAPSRLPWNCAFRRFSVSKDSSFGSLRSSNGFIRPNITAALLFCWPSMKL